MHRHLTINMDYFENFFNFLNYFYLEERLNISKFVSALQNLSNDLLLSLFMLNAYFVQFTLFTFTFIYETLIP